MSAYTQEFIDQARELWASGKSCSQIGNALGVTKNVIVGIARRYQGFPSRPSPIKGTFRTFEEKEAALREIAARKKRSVTLPPLPTLPARTAALPLVVRQLAVPPDRPVPEPVYVRKSEPCCWPIGEPRTPSFRYCDAPAPAGQSYCDGHHRIAYVPVRRVA